MISSTTGNSVSIVVVRKAAKLPSFIDAAPPAAVRREHAIGQRHMQRLTRAYMRASRSIYDQPTKDAILAAYADLRRGVGTIEELVDTVEWYNEADPLAAKRWELLGASITAALIDIVEDAGQGEARAHGWPFRFQVQKADIRVPINPFSIAWVRLQSAKLVREISDGQRALLREIFLDSFGRGLRPRAVLQEIEQTVGLTARERGWVRRRREDLMEEGLSGPPLERAVDIYAKRTLRNRAKRIARTETIEAYSQGLDDSWAMAQDEGLMPAGTLQKWVELTDSPRTCPICKDLGEHEPVPVGEPFRSDVLGVDILRPPAHPHCRCVKVLVFPE